MATEMKGRRRRTHRALATPASVVANDLRKTYPGGVEAVAGIDLEIASGEVFGLVGPNGAGKSTTVGMLTTTIVPSGGRASVGGFDVVDDPLHARSVSSVVFQDAVVDRALSGRRNLEIHARLWRVDRRMVVGRIDSVIRGLGLEDVIERPVETYSGGQRRRLEIARALVSRPRILFLDEPTVGLDPRIRHELGDVISRLRERTEMTILLTTHYLDEAQALCDRVAIMHKGRIVAVDTPRALLAGLGPEIVELRVDGDPAAAVEQLRSQRIAGDDAFVVGRTVTVPLHRRRASRALVVIDELDIAVSAVSTRPPNLDDVYLRLTGDRLADAV